MLSEILECCGHKTSTGNHTWIYLDCFQTKKTKQTDKDGNVIYKYPFFKRRLSDGRDIKKEIILAGLCPNCKHRILKFLWYDKKNESFHNWTECKDIKGVQADEIFFRRSPDWRMIEIPDPYKNEKNIKHSKKIPWKYGKAVDADHYVERYMDETANASKKIYSKLEIHS